MYQEYLNQVNLAPLTSDELKDLLNDDSKLDEEAERALEMLKAQKESLFTENRQKAEKNIEKEPQIIEIRSKLQELQSQAKASCDTVQERIAQIKEKTANCSQDTTLALLQSSAAESEEQSEAVLKQFNENELNVEAFLEGFLSVRKTMHLRKLKAEKMQELMRRAAQQQRASLSGGGGGGGGGVPNYSNLPGSGFYPSPSSGHASRVPYPLGPTMPMPPRPNY